jgi:hypothetical protein
MILYRWDHKKRLDGDDPHKGTHEGPACNKDVANFWSRAIAVPQEA